MFGLHSPITLFFSLEKIIFILSLSDQVLGSHSPCAYLIYTLQADIGFFFFLIFFNLNFSWGFHPLALQTGFTFDSPCRCWILKFLFFFFSIWIFHDVSHLLYYHSPSMCKFSLSMQIFGLHSPSRCLFLFLYMFLKLSLPLNKNIFGIFSALKPFQGWSFIFFIKCKTRSK